MAEINPASDPRSTTLSGDAVKSANPDIREVVGDPGSLVNPGNDLRTGDDLGSMSDIHNALRARSPGEVDKPAMASGVRMGSASDLQAGPDDQMPIGTSGSNEVRSDNPDIEAAETVAPGSASRHPQKAHPDALTGAPGSHPIGSGVGAAAAGVAGTVIGSVVPGVGSLIGGAVGAIVGAVAGGLAGKGVAEAIDPTAESAYWRDQYRTRPYHDSDYSFDDDYAPAYRYGWESHARHRDRAFDDVEPELASGWDATRDTSKLGWDKATRAARDAWERARATDQAKRTDNDVDRT